MMMYPGNGTNSFGFELFSLQEGGGCGGRVLRCGGVGLRLVRGGGGGGRGDKGVMERGGGEDGVRGERVLG